MGGIHFENRLYTFSISIGGIQERMQQGCILKARKKWEEDEVVEVEEWFSIVERSQSKSHCRNEKDCKGGWIKGCEDRYKRDGME